MNPALAAANQDFSPELVSIDHARIQSLAVPEGLKGMGSTLNGPLSQDPRFFVPYFIAMDTLNYQFWDVLSEGSFIRYSLNGKVGALAMQEAFHAAWLACLPESSADPLNRSLEAAAALRQRVAHEGVGFILGDIPAAQSRQDLLLEVLEVDQLRAASLHLLGRCSEDGSLGWQDAQRLAQAFPMAYGDRYLKKAQLTLMFIAGQWQATQGKLLTLDVSAAADYQLPKVLRSLGLLTYGAALAQKVDSEQLIEPDSTEERAIRAACIVACDKLAAQFNCGIAEVDFWLWLNRNAAKEAKFHLTRTTAY